MADRAGDNIYNFRPSILAPSQKAAGAQPLNTGGGGGTFGAMEARVTKLETHMEYVRRDLDALKAGQDKILAKLNDLPTKGDLEAWRWQWLATGLAIIALTVGGITGGLALIARFAG